MVSYGCLLRPRDGKTMRACCSFKNRRRAHVYMYYLRVRLVRA